MTFKQSRSTKTHILLILTSQVQGGLVSKELFHDYIMVWIQETRLHLLEQCKSEKLPWSEALTNYATSPFVENMYEQVKGALVEYEVIINRWPNYLLHLEYVSLSLFLSLPPSSPLPPLKKKK